MGFQTTPIKQAHKYMLPAATYIVLIDYFWESDRHIFAENNKHKWRRTNSRL